MRKYFPLFGTFLFLSLIFFSCGKQAIREITVDPGSPDTIPTDYYQHGIFVINEGNYNWGNASISFVDYNTGAITQNVFDKENGRDLGDVAQCMKIFNGKGYIVVNNSNRIEVVDIKTFKSIKTITGFYSPRNISFINSSKAYVTNLQSNISILDLRSNEITGSIPVEGWTENQVLYDPYMFVTAIGEYREPSFRRNPMILVIDTRTDLIIDTIPTGKEPIGLIMDNQHKLWVLCSGGYDYFEAPSLIRIDPGNRKIEEVFTFSTTQTVPSRLSINTSGDTLYFLNGGIYQMPICERGIPIHPLVNANGRLFYGLSVHPSSGFIFVSDALDYVQNGMVYQYNTSGTLIRQFSVGRIPGSFCFTTDSLR
ncbi:MAG: YncE family protein [Bacteroidales bacterium]|nr:YncE family protein [Bacteroidales bacterium]